MCAVHPSPWGEPRFRRCPGRSRRRCWILQGDLEPDVGAVLLVGDGPNFCTGGNVKAFAESTDLGKTVEALAGELHDLVRAFAEVPVPVVAAVHGWAAGAGMSLVLAADIAVAGTLRPSCVRPTRPSGSPPTAASPGRCPAPSVRPAPGTSCSPTAC